MTHFHPNITVEEAISLFPRGENEVEIYEDEGQFIGYLTLDSLSAAVQQGELTSPILFGVVVDGESNDLYIRSNGSMPACGENHASKRSGNLSGGRHDDANGRFFRCSGIS